MARSSRVVRKPSDETGWSLPVHQARSRETRDRLLAAAERVFYKKGYNGARIVDIAEEAGCSVGAVYIRFKDKDALFSGILEDFGKNVPGLVADTEGRPLSDDPALLVRRLVRGSAEQFETHRGLLRAMMEKGFDDAKAFKPLMALRDRAQKALEMALSKSRGSHGRDADLAVRVASQMIFGFLINSIVNPYAPARVDGNRAVAELESAVLRYLKLE